MKCLVSGCTYSGDKNRITFTKDDFKLVSKREDKTGFFIFKFRKCKSWEESNSFGRKKKTVDINKSHRMFGHVGETILQNTCRKQGIELTGEFHCDACCICKAKQKRTAKNGKNPRVSRLN